MKRNSMLYSGVLIFFFGLFAVIIGIPFSYIFLFSGLVMLALGLLIGAPVTVEPEVGKKFCWFCYEQIPADAGICPYCKLKQ